MLCRKSLPTAWLGFVRKHPHVLESVHKRKFSISCLLQLEQPIAADIAPCRCGSNAPARLPSPYLHSKPAFLIDAVVGIVPTPPNLITVLLLNCSYSPAIFVTASRISSRLVPPDSKCSTKRRRSSAPSGNLSGNSA